MSRPRLVTAPDGARIAAFSQGGEAGARPPLLLVHGTASDHTTWRVSGPLFARSRTVFAIDRRGRGMSTDGPVYDINREYEDIAAVADALARDAGGQVDVLGHSYGGRIALGWRPEQRFEPALSQDRRDGLYAGWKQAVARTRLRALELEAGHL
ncbi:MAG: alpha/beta fold hydrolase [Chloroflexi bacterium]|nr:alpha/beta fold hydrolase [Chloroflexota bacterium]